MLDERDTNDIPMSLYDGLDNSLESLFVIKECLSILDENSCYFQSNDARFAVIVLHQFISNLEARLKALVHDACTLVQETRQD